MIAGLPTVALSFFRLVSSVSCLQEGSNALHDALRAVVLAYFLWPNAIDDNDTVTTASICQHLSTNKPKDARQDKMWKAIDQWTSMMWSRSSKRNISQTGLLITQFYRISSTETDEVGNWLFRLNGLNKHKQTLFKTQDTILKIYENLRTHSKK